MNNELKPYGEYKDSKVEWIGSIPSHWQVRKNSIIFTEIVDTNHPTLELLSILCTKGIVKQNSTERKIRMSEDNKAYKKICVGDIGYNLMNAFMGGIGASKYEGIISPAYAVCRPKIMLNSWYYHYLFRIPLYQSEFNKNSYGIMYERNRLYFDRFKRILSFIPSIEEQNQIVKYLDFQLFKINKFIKAKKKLISVLKEQKQAVINEAVTKGINPDVKMKPSGIEWLGDIPEHWEVTNCKRIITLLTDYTANGSFGDLAKNVKYLNTGYARIIRLTDLRTNLTNDGIYVSESAYKYLKKSALYGGEFLIANVGAYSGFSCLMPKVDFLATLAPNMMMARFENNKISNNFAIEVFNCSYIQTQLKIKANNTCAQPKINKDDFKQVVIALPSVEEQVEITKYIVEKTAIIDKSISEIEKEITLITEYKIRLISDVVTGKVDVRNIVIDEEITEDTELEEEFAEEEAIEVSSEEDNFDN